MRNIIIFVALLGAAAIFTVLYCLIVAGSQAEKKLTEIMRKEEEHVPCIGYCIARLHSEMKGKKGRG